jgi:hypothetical protein
VNVSEILSTLATRNACITLLHGRLLISPPAALTPELRAAMRANRADLERHIREQIPAVRALLNAFGGELLPQAGVEILRGDCVEEHTPATVGRSCFPMRNACSEFSPAQLMGFAAGQLTADRGCGDCEIFRARLRMARLRERLEETRRRERAKAYANRESFAHPPHEDAD